MSESLSGLRSAPNTVAPHAGMGTTDPVPLSFQQRWLLDLARRHPAWNCASGYTFCLKGVLSVPALQHSLQEIVRRHDSMRTRIVSTEGRRGQVVDEPCARELEMVSIEGASVAQIEANAGELAAALYELKVDPSIGPLWIARLLKLSDREHWLVLVMHRLIAECSSIERFFQEVRALYDELTVSRASAFPVTPPQYTEYAATQEATSADWEKRHGAYWRTHLSGASTVRWPGGSIAQCATRGALGKMSCAFGSELSTGLRDLARQLRVLAPTLMLAVYSVTLWRWTGQKDFILPFNVAGRQTQQRAIVGYFNYVLYLRVELTGQETFRALLDSLSAEFYRALAHQDFGRIAAQRPELLAGTLFQWITWHPDDITRAPQSTPDETESIVVDRVPIRDFGEGLTIVPPGMSHVEITLFDSAEGINALGTYSAERFSAETMQRLVEDLRTATQRFVQDPAAPIAW